MGNREQATRLLELQLADLTAQIEAGGAPASIHKVALEVLEALEMMTLGSVESQTPIARILPFQDEDEHRDALEA